jgi:hypothetical protein
MTLRYSETRIGWPLIGALLVLQIVVLVLGLYYFDYLATIGLSLIPLLLFLNLYSAQVSLDSDFLCLSYGIGLVRWELPVEFVQSCDLVPNNYWTWVYDTSLEVVLRVHLRGGGCKILAVGNGKRLMGLISSSRRV